MEFPQFLQNIINEERLAQIVDKTFLQQELEFLNNKNVRNYYKHIIENVDIDKNNIQNSYILYLINKVDNIDITKPVKYNPGRTSMPDIDVDVPAHKRDAIIQYIKDKFGHNRVSQLVTFQTLKGRGALKAVFRAHNVISPSEMNQITKFFPEEAKIADELQIMKDEEGESSIIRWTLENDKKGQLKDWCYIDDNGNLQGPLAKYFEQAIRLEGTKCSQSKHAAGILIAPDDLTNLCPMIYDSKTKNMIAGYEMSCAEDAGMIKYDILGISLLSKLMGIQDILKDEIIQND